MWRGRVISVVVAVVAAGGCGEQFNFATAPLFTTPLTINGNAVEPAVIDTGGGYELILKEPFGLEIVDTIEILAFGGKELVGLTQSFEYEVGGFTETAEVALVGVSACDCNGVGFYFFRKTGALLKLDFVERRAFVAPEPPQTGVELPFEPPPPGLPNFDSAFVTVSVEGADGPRDLLALLDTGTNRTVMRREMVKADEVLPGDQADVLISHPFLGTVSARVGLFDTADLPDVIIGTDIMGTWSDEWYFYFAPRGGLVMAMPRVEDTGENGPFRLSASQR